YSLVATSCDWIGSSSPVGSSPTTNSVLPWQILPPVPLLLLCEPEAADFVVVAPGVGGEDAEVESSSPLPPVRATTPATPAMRMRKATTPMSKSRVRFDIALPRDSSAPDTLRRLDQMRPLG